MKLKETFINIAELHLETTTSKDHLQSLTGVTGEQNIDIFSEQTNCLTLYVSRDDEVNKLSFAITVNLVSDGSLLIFTKLKPCMVSEKNFSQEIQTIFIPGSPLSSLYQSLSYVYIPLIKEVNVEVFRKLENFEHYLGSVISCENENSVVKQVLQVPLTENSLDDEVDYWNTLSTFKNYKVGKSACEFFRENLSQMSKEFRLSDVLSLNDFEALLEKSYNGLDDLWKYDAPYPEDRIKHLMEIIGFFIWKFSCARLKEINLWESEYSVLSEAISQCVSLTEKWILNCTQLTEIFWPNYNKSPWKDGIYQPKHLLTFKDILNDILSIRAQQLQLTKLLSVEEQEQLKTKEMFQSFKDLDILTYGIRNNNNLTKMQILFENIIRPTEERVALKLKQELNKEFEETRQLIHQFSQYCELLTRPIIKTKLKSERQKLFIALNEYIGELQSQSIPDVITVPRSQQNTEFINEIMKIRQLEQRTADVRKISTKLLDDLPNYDNLESMLKEITEDLKNQNNKLFESWSDGIITSIKKEKLSLRESDPVVEFSDKNFMKVNFSPKLATLITEVRQLSSMGYRLPHTIKDTVFRARKFLRYSRILEQIADFHNTIGDKMIPSQKPMMLADALALSKLVQEQKVVSWSEEKAVAEYVKTLKIAVDKLFQDNNLLSSYHNQILQKINALWEVDIIKHYSTWKETQKYVRDIFRQLESKGFRNMQSWRIDLDNALANVLEQQYVRNVKTLHLYLPEIHADLIYRQSSLEYSPDEKELRQTYDQQLQKFLDIPKNIETFSESREIFRNIIKRNEDVLLGVSRQTDDLFKQLEAVKDHWQSWLQLESLDTNKLSSWQQWDLHFRASKTFGQEVAKLPSTEERVGCFLIGLSRLRSDLESHNRSYWDQLVNSLKVSIDHDTAKVQSYINQSTAALTKQPLTMEELGETGMEFENIMRESEEMKPLFEEVLKKSETLSRWSREYIDTVNVLEGAWNRLISLFDNHQHIIAQQVEMMKTKLSTDKENLLKELDLFASKWEQVKFNSLSGTLASISIEDLEVHLTEFNKIYEEWTVFKAKIDKLRLDMQKFHIGDDDLDLVEKIENDLSSEKVYWSSFEQFLKEFKAYGEEPWLVARRKLSNLEEFLRTRRMQLEELEPNELVSRISQEILRYEAVVPLLKYVKGEDFSDKHWFDTFNLLGIEVKPVDQLTVYDLFKQSKNIETYSKELQLIAKKAGSEIIIRQALSDLDRWDLSCKFILVSHTNSKGDDIMLIKEFKDILNEIGDNQSLLQSMKNSTDYEYFSERVNIWENKLSDLDYFLTALAKVQKKWLYLEPIFSSGTLTEEKSRFDKIDRDFRHISAFIQKDLRVAALSRYPNLKSLLDSLLEQLHRCQITLENFLKEKRRKFPRFQFLSDDDLLEIVGQSSKENILQAHISKLFSGINRICLNEGAQEIIAMCSAEGEIIPLTKSINISKPVEDWLNVLVEQMQSTLKALLVQRQNEKETPDPDKYPSQILCLAESIIFTNKCEQAIGNMTLSTLLMKYKDQLNYYSSLELSNESGQTSESGKKTVLELKLKALMLDTIHHIAVIEELLNNKIVKISDWVWQKQLRYYSNSSGDVTVKMANAILQYSYEYLGNGQKLVRTTLTEKCFLTLTQALHLGMGGNPYGPAGTGKTESVKALGALLGRQVLVFNCDENVDTKSMARILTGLVETGAWGCFDEFNRLEEATLSAITMLLHPIQVAIKTNSEKLQLFEREVSINKHCGIFVTLNPAGGNYGARNKLPDNLKQLFRPVVMTHPDNEQISKSLLLCDGFQNASVIAKKIVVVFDLASKLMNRHIHYDWGLRSIRTALTECGRALKNCKLKNKTCDESVETNIVLQVLKNDTLPKLSYIDSLKFNSILEDVFQKKEVDDIGSDPIVKYIEDSFGELDLIKNERQVTKCLEFYNQLRRRMGVAIVGPPRTGKTTIRSIVFNAIKKMNQQIKVHEFNPKCMTKAELLGKLTTDSNQWVDGVLTSYSLQVAAEKDVWSWIVCDGDIDPEWIESLNSVLDDNRLLSLPSGWRIQFEPNVNFVFETHEVTHASPATVSRIGIVFVNEEDLNLEQYIQSFCNKLSEERKYFLEPLVNDYVLKALFWTTSEAEMIHPCSKLSVVDTVLSQLSDVTNKEDFAAALAISLAQQLKTEYREAFIQQVYEWTGVTVSLQYFNSYNETMTSNNATGTLTSDGDSFLVHTGQIKQYLKTIEVWLRENNEQNFLIFGPNGSAKTLMVREIASKRTNLQVVAIHCTANLKPSFIISKLLEHSLTVNGPKGKILKPIKGSLLIYFKNLQLLKPDKWGTNMSIEFINQLIKYKGYYNSNVEFIGTENLVIVGSLSTSKMYPRFISQMRIINVSLPTPEEFSLIVSSHVSEILKKCSFDGKWTKSTVDKLALFMIEIFDKVKAIPPNNRQYLFAIDNVTKWCKNLSRYKCDQPDLESFLVEVASYETLDIFGNKMTNENEREALHKIIQAVGRKYWGGKYKDVENNYYYVPNMQITEKVDNMKKLSTDEWCKVIEMGINKCELDGQHLGLDINNELLYLTATIMKALSQPGGNVLLIGKNGVGRKSAVKIISGILGAKTIAPESSESSAFNNTMKTVLQRSGLEEERVFLQVEDQILKNSSNLNSINSLISCGEIPNIYSATELDSLVKALDNQYHGESFDGNLVQYFFKRVKSNCHTIAYLDADNSDLWEIIQNCPSFIEDTHIVYLSNWSKESIESTPRKILKNLENEEILMSSEPVLISFSKMHSMIREDIATPSRFMSLVHLYVKIYEEKSQALKDRRNKLKRGVEKLAEAQNLVKELRLDAEQQQTILEEKQAKANASLNMISDTMRGANTQKEEMENLKFNIQEESVKLTERKKQIEIELSEVEPLIQEARSAVGSIKSESLSEIRSLRAPPEIIRDILEGVLRLMGIQDTSWNSMKTFLAKRGIKEEIRSFDANRIQIENRQAVEKLMMNKKESFDAKAAKRASAAAAPLAAWVAANVKYSYVLDKIRPLEREQNKLKENLLKAEMQLTQLGTGLSNVDSTVEKLKQQLSEYTKEATEVEINLNAAKKTLNSAEKLISKLSDEYERWKQQLEEIFGQVENLPINCLLAAGCITYLSGETEEKRNELLARWCKELNCADFNFESFCSTEREQFQWQSEGLPSDKISVQNTIILLNGESTPFIIDPSSSATKWLKEHFKSRNIECIIHNSDKFKNQVEFAVRFGKTILIEEIDEISSTLYQILRKELVFQGERKLIQLNGKLVDYNENFTPLLCSRNENLELPPSILPLINLMNFSITYSGLVEQLLNVAVCQENPDFGERRRNLLKEREDLEEKQANLQNQLLNDLINSTGNILKDSKLLESLNKTKESFAAIIEALEESKQLHNKLQAEYELFKNISNFGSLLYFTCLKFARSNSLYLLSIPTFIKLFIESLQTFQDVGKNAESQTKHLLSTVYRYMSRGIFEADRLKFVFYLIQNLFPNEVPASEWNVFVGKLNLERVEMDELPLWIPKHCTRGCQNLQANQPDLYSKMELRDFNLWKSFMTSNDPINNIPTHLKLRSFQKVLLIQALRPDRLHSTMRTCAQSITGLTTLEPPVLDLSSLHRESSNIEPILILAVAGADPISQITEFAKRIQVKYVEVALGGGQEPSSLEALKICSDSGHWLILKNLHLVTYWLPVLTQHLKDIQPNDSFRLWLISEPTPNFHSVLAQNSMKLVFETSQGVKNNILRTFSLYGKEYFEKLNGNSARIFFVASCIHALLQERRKYIPQGWSRYYDFSDTDLSTAIKLIEDIWNTSKSQVHWKSLSGLFSDAVYGGKIEIVDDVNIMETYVNQYFTDEILSHKWKPFDLTLNLPSSAQYQEYLNALKVLPKGDPPIIFGLPENIDRAWEQRTAWRIITELKNVDTVRNSSFKFHKDKFSKSLTPFMSFWKKLNQGHQFLGMTNEDIKTYSSAVQLFIKEEFNFALGLLRTIHQSFATLNKICKELINPQEEDMNLAMSLMNHESPKSWLRLWNGPKEPKQYLQTIMQKTLKLHQWKNEEISNLLKQPMNVSVLFHPEAFFVSHKQDYSRTQKCSIDKLSLKTNWKATANGSLVLTGILIEGGILEDTIKPCSKNSENITTAPDCYLSWVLKEELKTDNTINVPFYATSERDKKIAVLQVPGNKDNEAKYIQAGLAFYADY